MALSVVSLNLLPVPTCGYTRSLLCISSNLLPFCYQTPLSPFGYSLVFLIQTLYHGKSLGFLWVPRASRHWRQWMVDSPAKSGASLSNEGNARSLTPSIGNPSFVRQSLLSTWRRSVRNVYQNCQIPPVSPEQLAQSWTVRC